MAVANPAAKQTCTYKHGDWSCPFDAESGSDLCTFHIPKEDNREKENAFWCEFANYWWALLSDWDMQDGPPYRLNRRLPSENWLTRAPGDWQKYRSLAREMRHSWRFTGFVFPAMDDIHHFQYVDFPKVDFSDARFAGRADFFWAGFKDEARFEDAQFLGNASFRDARIDDKLLFFKARIFGDFDLSYAHVKHRLHFGGTKINPGAALRLWGLNLGQGSMGPAFGEVVFRDLPEQTGDSMSRVSFLHTVVYEDRPCFRFESVCWQKDPKTFLLDAKLALNPKRDWPQLGVTPEREEEMLRLFNIITEPGLNESPPERKAIAESSLYDLVRLDVERTAREIRRFYENHGSYPEAGNFHIAEMEYRRTQAQRFGFQWHLLTGYKCFSMYGESVGRALAWFGGIWFVSALLYMFAGFTFGKAGTVRYALTFDERFSWSALWQLCASFLHALAFSFVSMVPGYFRFTAPTEWATWATPFLVVTEAVFGIGLLTLFLLAIRRRFRR